MEKDLAGKFKALGDPTRLRIYTFLCDCCCPVAVERTGDVRPVIGPTVGEVCCHITGVEQSSSNISFHLKELRNAGLITMEKRGKNVICGVDAAAQETMLLFFAGLRKDKPDCC
jgi:ArsR family transcriptional regulator